jgi:hypothetical protein
MSEDVVSGFGIFEDTILKFAIFQGSRGGAQEMLNGFKRAPLNKKLNLTLHEIEIIITKKD